MDAGIDASVATISVAESIASVNFPVYLLIGSELVYSEAASGGDFGTCTRGADGTTAAAHISGDFAFMVIAANHYNQVKDALIKIETELGTDPAGSLTDVKTRLAVVLENNGTMKSGVTIPAPIFTGAPTLTGGDFTNMPHDHADADDGGVLVAAAIAGLWGYTIPIIASSPVNVADGITYYAGPAAILATAYASSQGRVPKAGTVKAVQLIIRSETAGTSEAVSAYFRLNDTTDTTLSTSIDMSSANVNLYVTGLSVAVTTSSTWAIKIVAPTWVTNPLSVRVGGFVYIEG